MRTNLLSKTKNELILLMKHRGSITAQEAGEELDLAVSTVRQHLSKLELDEFITSHFERQGVGRPRKKYRLTEKSDVLFVNNDRLILSRLIEFLHESGATAHLEEFFDEMAAELLGGYPRQFQELSREQKQARLEQLLESEGYLPELTRKPTGELVIDFYHCPFAAVSESTSTPCEFERTLLSRLFNSPVIQRESIGDGNQCCRFVVKAETTLDEQHRDSA